MPLPCVYRTDEPIYLVTGGTSLNDNNFNHILSAAIGQTYTLIKIYFGCFLYTKYTGSTFKFEPNLFLLTCFIFVQGSDTKLWFYKKNNSPSNSNLFYLFFDAVILLHGLTVWRNIAIVRAKKETLECLQCLHMTLQGSRKA